MNQKLKVSTLSTKIQNSNANSERTWPHCDRDHDETTSNNGPSSLVCGNEPNKQKDRRGKPYIAISFILRILKIQKTIIKFAYCNDKFFWLFTFEYVLIFFSHWPSVLSVVCRILTHFFCVLCSNYQTNKKSRHHWKVDFIYFVCPNQIESKVSCTFSTKTKNVYRKKSWYNTIYFVYLELSESFTL